MHSRILSTQVKTAKSTMRTALVSAAGKASRAGSVAKKPKLPIDGAGTRPRRERSKPADTQHTPAQAASPSSSPSPEPDEAEGAFEVVAGVDRADLAKMSTSGELADLLIPAINRSLIVALCTRCV